MNGLDRSVLIVGDELSLVERFVPLLRRSNLDVQRLLRPSGPIQLAEAAPHDLLIVVAPIANAARLFARTRAQGSPWRHTGVLLVAEPAVRAKLDPALTRTANRVVAPSASPDEFLQEVSDLLEVEPRVAVHASVQLKLVPPEGEPLSVPIENLSTSGMFLALDEPPPVGSVFGFALDLPTPGEPIRGQAGVVRKAPAAGSLGAGIGVRFLSVGGDGIARIERFVARERAVSASSRRGAAPNGGPGRGARATASGVTPRPASVDLEQLQRELAELQALLDELLPQGLARRLGVADWYLTGMEIGLDSLQSFSAVLDAVYAGRVAAVETQTRIADLALVRRKLTEFAQPQQELRARIRILLELRPPLERLLRELARTGAGEIQAPSPARPPEAVTQVVAEIRRLVGVRKSVDRIRSLLVELGATRYLFAPGAQRRIAERIWQEYPTHAGALGFGPSAQLVRRKERKAALAAVDRDLRQLDQRLATIHERVYAKRSRHLASRNPEADLCDPRCVSILSESVAPGLEYLLRAFSAYRHALELAGADPGLLDRAASLGTIVRAAERARSASNGASTPAASGRGA